MARLFTSLYLFITLALICLSAGLERIFIDSAQPQNMRSEAVVRLLEAAKKQELDLLLLATDSGFKVQILSINDIAWPTSSAEQLAKQKAIVLHDAKLGEQIFIALDKRRVLQLTLVTHAIEPSTLFLYSGLFFVLLALLIGLWVWPLWRDLVSLKHSVSILQPDGSIANNNIGKSSLIAPIAAALNAMSQHVQSLMQSQRELSGAVAHEFRTPLSRLKFALAVKPAPGSSPWNEMENDVDELERLVQEMLDYAGTEAQMPEMNLAEIPILELCQHIVTRLQTSHLSAFDIHIEGDDSTILADPHFIERAIENLLLNAGRYANKSLGIYVEKSNDFVDIAIEDDGRGVDESLRDKIFEPFFRPDEGRDRAQGGAGLGLAIVKRIQQWHGGSCWVSDSSLGGAKFVLRFTNHLSRID